MSKRLCKLSSQVTHFSDLLSAIAAYWFSQATNPPIIRIPGDIIWPPSRNGHLRNIAGMEGATLDSGLFIRLRWREREWNVNHAVCTQTRQWRSVSCKIGDGDPMSRIREDSRNYPWKGEFEWMKHSKRLHIPWYVKMKFGNIIPWQLQVLAHPCIENDQIKLTATGL